MPNLPLPAAPSSSSPSRWLLPVLALLTVFGIIGVGAWLGHEEPPLAAKTAPMTPTQFPAQAAATRTIVAAQAPFTSGAPSGASTLQPAATSTGGNVSSAVALAAPPLPDAASVATLTDPLPTEQALAPGEAARVRVTVGGVSTPLLLPNQVGSFPRVYLPLGGQADVQLQLPEAAPGERVVAAVEDGGQFVDGKPVQTLTLDGNRQVAFRFQASQSLGTFRISVRHQAQTKTVTFWAGDRTAAFNY